MAYGGQSGEVSNNIFPMHTQMLFNMTPAGVAAPIISRSNIGSTTFNVVKAALGTADPVTSMYNTR